MKLTPSSVYLSVLLDSFESQILPELQSEKSRGNAGYFINTIKELLRREIYYPEALAVINEEGLVIEKALSEALGVSGFSKETDFDINDKHASQLDIFENLTKKITELTESLSEREQKTSLSASRLLRQAAEWECNAHNTLLGLGNKSADNTDGVNKAPLTRDAFQAYVQSVHSDGDNVEITVFEPITGGFGNQTWSVTAKDASSLEHHWILRKNDRALLKAQHKTYNLQREFELVNIVSGTGFPAPKPIWMATDAPGSDAPFYVMERLLGKPPGSFLGGAEKMPEELLLACAELLARLHSLPLESFRGFIGEHDAPQVLDETVTENFQRNIAENRAYVKERNYLPSPTLVYLFDWLERNVPQDESRPVLTHGDFGIHNLLLDKGRVSGVLDWEAAGFCSPGLDLSYFKAEVEKHMDWNIFVRHYEACGGRVVDAATLNYCRAYQAMKVSVGIFGANRMFQDGDLAEIRHTTFELGLNPYFMKMMLDSAALDN